MPSFANIEILGHVGREPEQRYTPAGTMIVSFSVAVNPPGKRQPDGSYLDSETDWYRITCFGRTAELAMDRVVKGQVVHIRGTFKTDHWTAQDGTARTTLDVLADRVTSLAPRNAGDPVGNTSELQRSRRNNERPANDADIDSMPF